MYRVLCSALLLVSCVLPGCAPAHPPPREQDASEENLLLIYQAYKMAEIRTKHIPEKLDDIRSHFVDEDPATILTSPNDDEPYVILWGTSTILRPPASKKPGDAGTVASPNQLPLLAYEKTGKAGRRYALNIAGKVATLTEDEFKQATRAARPTSR
jgi:hypothetical protein